MTLWCFLFESPRMVNDFDWVFYNFSSYYVIWLLSSLAEPLAELIGVKRSYVLSLTGLE